MTRTLTGNRRVARAGQRLKRGQGYIFRMQVWQLRVSQFYVLLVTCLGFHTTSRSYIPQHSKFRPNFLQNFQRQVRLVDLKPVSVENGHKTTLKSYSKSAGPKWIFSRTKKFNYFFQRLNYFVQRLLVGGVISKLAIFIAVTAIFIFGGAFFIWLAYPERCSIEFALSKSYMLLFRSFPRSSR
jgi:hypothetical protein